MSEMFTIIAPIIPGQKERWDNFIANIKTNHWEEFCSLRRKFGLHERTYLHSTPMGEFILVTIEGENPAEMYGALAQSETSFMNWFREEVKAIHGVDLKEPMPGPAPILVADSNL